MPAGGGLRVVRVARVAGPLARLCWATPPLDGSQGNPMVHCDRRRGHRGPHSWACVPSFAGVTDMSTAKPQPAAGDPCPQCGDEFVAHRAPTDLERKAAEDHEQARPLPPRVDTASEQQLAELGGLYVCRGCGYQTRIKADDDAAPAAAGAGTKGKGRGAGSSKD